MILEPYLSMAATRRACLIPASASIIYWCPAISLCVGARASGVTHSNVQRPAAVGKSFQLAHSDDESGC